MDGSVVEALVIHAVYLLNCGSEDAELRQKSLDALKVALHSGSQLGAVGRRPAPRLGVEGRTSMTRWSGPGR